MRKYLYLAMAAASATVLAAPVVAQAAPAAAAHVLTITKAGGTAVKTGAILKASLAKGATVKVVIGPITATCKSSSFTAKVIKNPAAPNTATESVTAETIAKCSDTSGITISGVKALNLPYNSTVSDKKGFPVTVSGTKTSKPLELKASAKVSTTSITCIYGTAKVVGAGSNKGNTITFKNQKLKVEPGSNSLCTQIGPASLSAKYGPVKDTSVKGSPAVFVN